MSSVQTLSEEIYHGLFQHLPSLKKSPRKKLSYCIAAILEVQTCNTMEIANVIPLETERLDMRYQWLSRFLSTDSLENDDVMRPLIQQIVEKVLSEEAILILCLDQTNIQDRHGIVTLGVRYGNRALPLRWRAASGKGNIGFSVYEEILLKIQSLIPQGSNVVLMGDRFYGCADLILFCREQGWDYRLRLKGNLRVECEEGFFSTSELATLSPSSGRYFEEVLLTEQQVPSFLSILHEEGHEEAWILASASKLNYYSTLDYGMRWGVESMFSDYKTRGFSLEDTKLECPQRVERLMLILSIALHWAFLTGKQDREENPLPREKNSRVGI